MMTIGKTRVYWRTWRRLQDHKSTRATMQVFGDRHANVGSQFASSVGQESNSNPLCLRNRSHPHHAHTQSASSPLSEMPWSKEFWMEPFSLGATRSMFSALPFISFAGRSPYSYFCGSFPSCLDTYHKECNMRSNHSASFQASRNPLCVESTMT